MNQRKINYLNSINTARSRRFFRRHPEYRRSKGTAMSRKIRKVFGAWIALWLMLPPLLFLVLAVAVQEFNKLIVRGVVPFDAWVKRALRRLDRWIEYGNHPGIS